MTLVLVALGAAVGAPLRYLTDRMIRARHHRLFPWGTFVVNAVGSLVLGVLAGASMRTGVPGGVAAAVGTGLCGALTTYSTFGYETVRLVQDGNPRHGVLNVVANVGVGTAAAVLGVALGLTACGPALGLTA